MARGKLEERRMAKQSTRKAARSKSGGTAARKAAGAAAKGAARAVPGPGKPNPALKKFKAAVGRDPKLRQRLLSAKTNDAFHAATVREAAKLGLHFTTAESKWHVTAQARQQPKGPVPRPSPWDLQHPGSG
jgi:hypothetical protein